MGISHDIVVYEDLQVQNLVRNHHLAKSFTLAARSAWGNDWGDRHRRRGGET
ncbi:hypothetical protein [Synechococcus sp. R5-12]|uniref:hypothetical protein n=1 Tax=Synechococcus sp. R5-12 TaxID=2421321 RepID=UPI0039C5CF1D